MFPSLNVHDAVFEGGGLNIIIYNFQTAVLLEIVGFLRNCGPFWEPGMYAVFLNIALAFNLFNGCIYDSEADLENDKVSAYYSVSDIFNCSYAPYMYQAICIRYPKY